jgi:hypothetical protein
MTDKDTIEEKLKKLGQAIGTDDSIARNVMSCIDTVTFCESNRINKLKNKLVISRLLMNRFTKFVAAALIIIAIIWGLNFIGGPDMAKVAWSNVTTCVDQVDFVHFYELKFRKNRINNSLEGWFAEGKVVAKKDNGTTFYDDGKTETVFNKDGKQIRQEPSDLGNTKGLNFFEKITQGLMQYENEDMLKQVPSHVGDDFLIYRFDPPERMKEWVESVAITVGRNSLLPVQMKIHRKDQADAYDLYIFDYEAPEKPVEFFDPQSISEPPHGKGEIVLDGEEVIIDISDFPGIKAVAIRLYSKYFENMGELKVFDAAVITAEGFRRGIARQIPWQLNKEVEFGMGDSKHWPDKKFRHVNAKIMLRPTEKKGTYLVKVRCWFDV